MNNLWHTIRERGSTWSLCAAVMAMPFSITLCHASLIVWILFSLADSNWTAKVENLKRNYQVFLLLALGGILILGANYSENQKQAWFEIEKQIFFFLIPLIAATSSVPPKKLQLLARLFCISCLLALSICIVHAFTQIGLFENGEIGTDAVNYFQTSTLWDTSVPKRWMFFSYVSLASGVGMHPTYLALYCAFCSIVLIKDFSDAKKTLLKAGIFVAIVFFSVSIIFLAARVVIAALILIYSIMIAREVAASKLKFNVLMPLVVLMTLLAVGVVLNPVTKYRQIDEVKSTELSISPDTNYNTSTGIRASLWWLSVKAYVNANVLTGVGPGDVHNSVRKMSNYYGVTNVLDTYDPHSQYLYFLLSTGIIGLSLFLAYVGISVLKAWRYRDLILLNFLILFLVVCLTESVLELQKGIVFFSIFFSMMTFSEKTELTPKSNLVTLANAGN